MQAPAPVVAQTCHAYLNRLKEINFHGISEKLGVTVTGQTAVVPFFNRAYRVSSAGILDPSGNPAAPETCIILSRYLLMCPAYTPREKEWTAYRDFKDAGPLTVYFANDVEQAMARHFSGGRAGLEKAGQALGGVVPGLDAGYDLSLVIPALPRLPLLLLFNDTEEEFAAKCLVLFERRADQYLDAECLAVLGRLLFVHLKNGA